MGKDVEGEVVAHLQHLPGGTEENREKALFRIVHIPADIRIGYLQNCGSKNVTV
jgi:hypothetical protein